MQGMNIPNSGSGSVKAMLLASLLLLSVRAVATPTELIREIAVDNLPDIAIASFDQHGPVIFFNPSLNLAVGPWLSEFFRAHEIFHHKLGHLQRQRFIKSPYSRMMLHQKFEKEADCEAAKIVSPYAVLAAVEFFVYTQGPTRADLFHPTGYARAETIRRCGGDR